MATSKGVTSAVKSKQTVVTPSHADMVRLLRGPMMNQGFVRRRAATCLCTLSAAAGDLTAFGVSGKILPLLPAAASPTMRVPLNVRPILPRRVPTPMACPTSPRSRSAILC